jgi:aryl-alcohol dehydrogenase-like predicted oxidoreductase
MEYRKLGRSGLEVSPLSFGGNVLGWTADEPTSFKILDAFVAAGGNFIDTADVYSRFAPGLEGGESETVLGNWLKQRGNREKLVIATKVGMDMGPGGKGLSRQHIVKSVEGSLRRLQTDYIDLYQSHRDDQDAPLEETLETYAELVRQGKVRAIGASNYSAERLSQALKVSAEHGYPRYESLQPPYNRYDRADYETGLEQVCQEHGLGVITYFSLASGFLSGKYRSEADLGNRARSMFVKKYLDERGQRILAALDEVAKAYNATLSQISLAWILARPSVTAPIVSATTVEQLNDIMKATEIKLDAATVERLNQASALDTVAK